MYVVHDNEGTILHSISGPDANYGKALTAADQQWIFLEGPFEFNPVTQYVDVEKKAAGVPHVDCLLPKAAPSVIADKLEIDADGADIATISGIPSSARVTVQSDAQIEFDGMVDDGQIELSAVTPTTYTVHVTPTGAKYLTASVQVVAK
jgi:hypothetical protein